MALAALQRYSEATDCYNTALSIDPLYTAAMQNKEAIANLGQVYVVTVTPTPTEVPVRFGTYTAPTTAIPVTIQPSAGQTAMPTPAAVTTSITSTPVPKKTTYAPLSPLGAVSAFAILGIAGFARNRIRK